MLQTLQNITWCLYRTPGWFWRGRAGVKRTEATKFFDAYGSVCGFFNGNLSHHHHPSELHSSALKHGISYAQIPYNLHHRYHNASNAFFPAIPCLPTTILLVITLSRNPNLPKQVIHRDPLSTTLIQVSLRHTLQRLKADSVMLSQSNHTIYTTISIYPFFMS